MLKLTWLFTILMALLSMPVQIGAYAMEISHPILQDEAFGAEHKALIERKQKEEQLTLLIEDVDKKNGT